MKNQKRRFIQTSAVCLCFLCLCACGQKKTGAAEYVEQGMKALESGDFAGARSSLKAAGELSPEEPGIFRAMGIVDYREGNFTEAAEAFETALGLLGETGQRPLREDILQYKADAEMQSGNYEAAVTDYTSLVSLDGENAEYLFKKGKALISAGRPDEAVAVFLGVRELAPENLDYCEDIYLTLKEQGKSEEGLVFLEDILKNCEQNEKEKERYGSACLEIARYDMEKGQYEQALQNLEAGLSGAEGAVQRELSYGEAVCYEYMGNYETALEKFTAYEENYGTDKKLEHEIAFLKTRTEQRNSGQENSEES